LFLFLDDAAAIPATFLIWSAKVVRYFRFFCSFEKFFSLRFHKELIFSKKIALF